jgi:hypothetical protein
LARAEAELAPPAIEPEPPIVIEPPVELPQIPDVPIDVPVIEEPPAVITDPPPIDIPEPPVVEPVVEEPVAPVEEPPVIIEEPAPPVDVPAPVVEEITPEEQVAVAVADLIASVGDAPISVRAMKDAGVTLADLPPDTPIAVREDVQGNEVVITAEVAVALELLSSPSDLVTAIFTDPAQAVLAIASIGADMSETERTESKHTVVATIIAAGAAINAVGAATGSTRTPSSGGGGGASSDSKGVRRRKP